MEKYWFYKDIGQIIEDRSGNLRTAVNGDNHSDDTNDCEQLIGRGLWGGSGPWHVIGPNNSWDSNGYFLQNDFWLTWMVKFYDAQSQTFISRQNPETDFIQMGVMLSADNYAWWVYWTDNTAYAIDTTYPATLGIWTSIALKTQFSPSSHTSQVEFYVNEYLAGSESSSSYVYDENTQSQMQTIVGQYSQSFSNLFNGFIHSWVVLDHGDSSPWETYYKYSNPAGYFDDGYNDLVISDCDDRYTDLSCLACLGCARFCFTNPSDCDSCYHSAWAFESCAIEERDGSIECFYPCFASWATWFLPAYNQWHSCVDPNATVQTSPGAWICNAGYYDADTTIGVECKQWHYMCDEWFGEYDFECTQCSANGYMQPPVATSNTCVSSCPVGYVTKSPEQIWSSSCNPICSSCSGDYDYCLSCASPYMTAVGGACQCNSGYWQSGSSWSSCEVPWSTCTSLTDCLTWSATYYLQPAPNTTVCLQTCPDDYYGNDSTLTWELCGADCKICDASDINYWFTCKHSKATAVSGVCTCIDGTYAASTVPTLDCADCATECSKCTQATNTDCIECDVNFYMQPPVSTSQTCQSSCPVQYFGNTAYQLWDDCHDDWETWTGANSNECITWNETSAYQSGGSWVCNVGLYPSNSNPLVCDICAPECSQCFDAFSTTCNTWASGFYYQMPWATSFTCKNVWDSDQYEDSGSNICWPCWIEWATWSSGGFSSCTSCIAANAKVDAGNCVWEDNAYMVSSSPLQCDLCHDDWSTCTGANQNEWTTWNDTNSYQSGGSWFCSVGFYAQNANPLLCMTCSPEWFFCYGGLNTECLAWQSGFYKQTPTATSDTCENTCALNEYGDDATRLCEPCYVDCATCTGPDDNHCTSCVDVNAKVVAGECVWEDNAYKQSDNPLQCVLWHADCSTCTGGNQNQWITWNDAFSFVSGGQWFCNVGFYAHNTDPLLCITCSPECFFCFGGLNTECTAWQTGFYIQTPTATSNTCENTCKPDEYGDDATRLCEPCFVDCATCTGPDYNQCISCEHTNAKVVAGECVWEDYAYMDSANPLQCILCHADWQTCTGANQNECITWNETLATQIGGSWICNSGYYSQNPDPLVCDTCPPECSICHGALSTNCTSWNAGFFKQRPTGTSDTCKNVCEPMEYGDTANNLWEPCHTECATWTGPNDNECTSCVDVNAKVVAGECVCEDHAHMLSDNPLQCILWAAECDECFAGNDNDSWMVCKANNFKQPPANSSTSCRSTCPAPYFGNNTSQQWELCDNEWTSCTGPLRTECMTCSVDNAVPNATPGEWICDLGYYEIQASPLICIQWAAECDTWSSANNNNDWGSCSAGYFKQLPVATSTKCRDNWPIYYYGDDSTREWDDCHIDWETCFGSDDNECLSCRDSFAVLVSDACECADGSYKTNSNPLIWEPCATEWQTCTADTNNDCITWNANYYLQTPTATSTQCRNGWEESEFEDTVNKLCLGCFSECSTWQGPAANECLTCIANGAVVSAGTWVCGPGLYQIDTSPLEWVECATECDGWTAPINNNACVNWAIGSYRLPPVSTSTSCRTYWPSGYFGNSSSNEWEQWDNACSEWDGPLDSNCTAWAVPFSSPVQGVCECLPTYYKYVTTGFACIDCADEWSECFATTNDDCFVCQYGNYKQPPANTSTSCRATCPSLYYADEPTLSCLPCFMNWDTCHGTQDSDCTSCINGHASPVSGVCTWDDHYYAISTLPLECSPCDEDCLTCDGPTNDDCLLCSLGRVLVPPEETSKSCRGTCPDGFFKSEHCEPCHDSCETCSGGFDSNCYECSDGYYMQPTEANTCRAACPLTYLENSVDNSWDRCHSSWESCFDLTDEGCSRCILELFGQPGNSSKCESDCTIGYFKNYDTRMWEICHHTCETCDAARNFNWLTCKENSQEVVDGQWLCKSNYYEISKDPFTCGACSQSWKTWYGPDDNNCYTCEALNSSPTNGEWTCVVPFLKSNLEGQPLKCKGCPNNIEYDSVENSCVLDCPESSYIENNECIPCTAPWIYWLSATYCTRCQEGYFANEQFICEQCDKTCITCENRAVECIACSNNLQQQSNGECRCPEDQAFVEDFVFCVEKTSVALSVSGDNTVSIEFTRDTGQELTIDDFSLNILDSSGRPIDTTWSLSKDNSQNYKIDVEPDSVDIPSGSTVNFQLTSEFMSIGQIDTSSQVLSGNLNEELAATALAEEEAAEASKETTSSGSTGIISSAAFVSTLSYNFAALWKIINYLQIITLFQFFNMSTTPELDGFLASLLKDSKIPNLYDFIIPSDYDAVTMPARFSKSSYKHPLVLDVFGHTMSIWFMVGFTLVTAMLLLDSGFPQVKRIANKIKDTFIWNGIIRIALETSIYIFIGCFLNLRFGVSGETHAIVNTLTSFGFLFLLSMFSLMCYKAIRKNSGNLDGAKCQSYRELTSELKPDHLGFSAYYSVFFMFRRASLCATVVFIESPRIQICLSSFINLSYFTWIVIDQPFTTRFINAIEIFCESTIVLTNLTMFFFTFDFVDKQILGYVVVLICLGGIGGFMVIIMRNFVEKVREKIKKIRENKQIGPKTEQEVTQLTERDPEETKQPVVKPRMNTLET